MLSNKSLALIDDKENYKSQYNHSENIKLILVKTHSNKTKNQTVYKEKEIITNDISRISSHNSTYQYNFTKEEIFSNLISLVPKEVDDGRMKAFLMAPLPQGKTMMCQIKIVVKTKLGKILPKYHVCLNSNQKVMMTAHKKLKATSFDYQIYQANNDYDIISEVYMGRVSSNFLKNKFSFYDEGKKYNKTKNSNEYRQQYGHAMYPINFVKSGPRIMKVILPSLNNSDEIIEFKPTSVLNFTYLGKRFIRRSIQTFRKQ